MTSSMVGGVVDDDNDIILKLPDALIDHILSFLPTEDVVRTCILSKRWKLIWYSVPTLSFEFEKVKYVKRQDLETFYDYVYNYMENRKKGMDLVDDSSITSFKFNMPSYYGYRKIWLLDKLLSFVVENKVKEIYLFLGGEAHAFYYCLPTILNDARYLTILELSGVKLDSSHSFSFPLLKTLSLLNVKQSNTKDDNVVFKFLLCCPSLEKLRIINYSLSCMDDRLRLQSLSLKFLELNYIDIKYELEVEAINLESLVIIYHSSERINFSSCKKIRNLSLTNYAECYQPSLEDLISSIPLLENFTLINQSSSADCLRISSQHLKSFTYDGLSFLSESIYVEIESAPRLEYFCYEDIFEFSISMESSNLINGKIVSREMHFDNDIKCFTNMLYYFLVKLNCSWNVVTVHVSSYEGLLLLEDLKIKNYPFLNWKHLRVITDYHYERESVLKDDLMRIWPSLETLSINKRIIF
ncbi:hypothetical protein CsatA_005868 [Cannabis sativa]